MSDSFILQVLIIAALTVVRFLEACKEFILTRNQTLATYLVTHYKAVGVKMAFLPFTVVGMLVSFEIAILATPPILGAFYYFIKHKEDNQKDPNDGVFSVQHALDLLFQYLTIVCLYFYTTIIIPS
jgi:hypothetical protein